MANRLANIPIKTSSKIKYYKNIKYPEVPLSSSDIYIITRVGDRLDSLANQFYNDVHLWWIISISNLNKIKRDSFFIKPGLQIRIPQNKESIIENYKKLNE
tara:strand:+ start:390 stop:692 length:303 start_codon:yes stop_codon:yes gene_type:complete